MFGDERKPQTDSTKKAYPIDTIVEFKSKQKLFKAWSNSLKSSTEIKPTNFVIVDEFYKLGGYGFYSNIVRDKKTEKFTVKDFNTGNIEYDDIYDRSKTKLSLEYHLVVFEGGDLVEYKFNSDTSRINVENQIKKIDINKYTIDFNGIVQIDSKFGKQNVPEFKQGKEIDKDTFDKVMDAVEIWKEYLG